MIAKTQLSADDHARFDPDGAPITAVGQPMTVSRFVPNNLPSHRRTEQKTEV